MLMLLSSHPNHLRDLWIRPRDDHTVIIRKPIEFRSTREISFENITQTPVNQRKSKWERYMEVEGEDEENFCLNLFGIL